jgi:hypothetical protein
MTPNPPKRFLPSIPAVAMPIFALGWEYIKKGNFPPIVVSGWRVIGFILPVAITTFDFRYLAKSSDTFADYFRPRFSADDFRQLFIPSWLRMLAWLVSAAFARSILRVLSVQF